MVDVSSYLEEDAAQESIIVSGSEELSHINSQRYTGPIQ